MNVLINDTNARANLSYVYNGIEIADDFIGNTGALGREFVWDGEAEAWRCDSDTFEWWQGLIAENEALDARIHALYDNYDREAVDQVVAEAAALVCDIEDIPAAVLAALEDHYGMVQ